VIGAHDAYETERESRGSYGCAWPSSADNCAYSSPYPPSAEILGALITTELLHIWENFVLSEAELDDLRRSTPSLQAIEKLDALILRQAETMGWRLALSPLVHLRFSEWDSRPDGPMLFEQYGRALKKSARLFQKREPPPIDDPQLYPFKEESVEELRRCLRQMRNAFSGRRAGPSLDELIDYFQKTVSAEGSALVHLKTNIDSWIEFFRANSTMIKPLLLRKRGSPAALFDNWFAWGKGLEPETIRQKISEPGKFLNNSRKC
jgi:hypothetical protein